MTEINTVSKEEWLAERIQLLEEEKALDRARDELSARRQSLPWLRVEEDYIFDGGSTPLRLVDLFEDKSQLIVQHFMYAPGWEEGCRSCSFWADQFNPAVAHLGGRDVAFAVVSKAPHADFVDFQARMGWTFRWVSSAPNNFSRDYHVCYSPEDIATGDTFYNFRQGHHYGEHAPGLSVFAKGEDGSVYHTYSCYARGLDMLNGAYHLLDLVPKGRDEQELPGSMSWLRLHDRYE